MKKVDRNGQLFFCLVCNSIKPGYVLQVMVSVVSLYMETEVSEGNILTSMGI
jgi:hypothetical protein